MKLVIICVLALLLIILIFYAFGVFDKTPENERNLKWLNRKYLFHLDEAKKNINKNEPVTEFHMEEAQRYKELMNRATGKAFMEEMEKPSSLP
jgi:hypothetical protein